jgi:hypothetical protein
LNRKRPRKQYPFQRPTLPLRVHSSPPPNPPVSATFNSLLRFMCVRKRYKPFRCMLSCTFIQVWRCTDEHWHFGVIDVHVYHWSLTFSNKLSLSLIITLARSRLLTLFLSIYLSISIYASFLLPSDLPNNCFVGEVFQKSFTRVNAISIWYLT